MMAGTLKRFLKFILNLSASLPSGLSPELLFTEDLYQNEIDRCAPTEMKKTPKQSDYRLGKPIGTAEKKPNV
jgi:hypothetical protein